MSGKGSKSRSGNPAKVAADQAAKEAAAVQAAVLDPLTNLRARLAIAFQTVTEMRNAVDPDGQIRELVKQVLDRANSPLLIAPEPADQVLATIPVRNAAGLWKVIEAFSASAALAALAWAFDEQGQMGMTFPDVLHYACAHNPERMAELPALLVTMGLEATMQAPPSTDAPDGS